TLNDYSATSIVDKIDKIDKIDQTDHTNSSTFNQIENTSTDNVFNVESTTSKEEEDPVWSTIEWNVQSSGIDEVSVITSNVWNDDNQQQVHNIRSKKDGILRDDFEENVWADVQIVTSLPNYPFLAAELSNDLAQSENHNNKIPLTLHEKVGQLAQERNQGLLTPPHSPTSQNIENVSLFSSTKENIEDKAINYKTHTSEIDQMDHFNADTSFDGSNIKSSFDDPLAESSEGDKDFTYNENIDGCEDLFIINRKVDGNISSDSKESIDSAEYSYIKDSEINGQEVKINITRIENVQNNIMSLENHVVIDDNDDFEILTNDGKSNQGLTINFDHLGSLPDSTSLWIAVLDILGNSNKISQSTDEVSPSIEDLAYNAQDSSDDDIKHDSDVPEKLIDLELNRDSSVNSQADNLSTLPASPQKSDIIFDFEELVDLEFTNSTKELTKKIEDPIKLQEIPDQFQMFMEFANGNMESQSSLHLYDHETNSSFTSISSDFGEFVSAENVQTLPECSSFLPKFKEIASSVNDDNSLNPNLKQNLYNNSPESTPQDTWMSLSDLSFLEYITNTKTTSPKISSSEPHRDLLLDFNNFISLKSSAK
ncbi:41372_t:CDS:2, partial [Gigaspora margarita]